MISLKQAFGLCRITDDDMVFLRKWDAPRCNYQLIAVSRIKETYDLKATKVMWIEPRFESFGPDFLGMEFGLYEKVK